MTSYEKESLYRKMEVTSRKWSKDLDPKDNIKWGLRRLTEYELRELDRMMGYNDNDKNLIPKTINEKTFTRNMFMAEMEGLLPTRFGNIKAVIADIKRHPSESIDMEEFEYILNAHNLSFNDLTQAEKNYIDASIA